MKNNDIVINTRYNSFRFPIYKIEVGVLWTKEEGHNDYDCYNEVYDKQYGYYNENVAFELDYSTALRYAKKYVEDGVNGTYAIISKLDFDSEYYEMGTEHVLDMVQSILGGACMEEYIELFREELYDVNNVIYSLRKEKNKEHSYYLGKGNGKIIENFIKKFPQNNFYVL